MMGRYREKQQLNTVSQIDVTPLVDLTFLLLIVFMITAPVLENAVDVSPPELNAPAIEDKKHKVINMNEKGEITLDNRQCTLEELQTELGRLHTSAPDTQIFIRADETRPYGKVMAMMRAARHAGFVNISLVTLSEEE